MTSSSDRPLGSIALALSGGGYRAAAFHLGTLDLLHRAGLLEQVEALSTVSGGTIVGCAYARFAAGKTGHRTFEEFAAAFFALLSGTHVIELAIDAFGKAAPPTLSRRRSLITAAAQVYAATGMIGGDSFATLMEGGGHLREISFNATEFQAGRSFRFQVSASPRVNSGSFGAALPQDVARRVRLADIVAASSCFPGGFEPLQFPDDFVFPREALDGSGRPAGLPPAFPTGIALMDGGIFDNQGVASLLLAEERRQPQDRFGLFIVSDTDQSDDDAMLAVHRPPKDRGLTLGGAFRLTGWVAAACLASAAVLAGDALAGWRRGSFGWIDLLRTLFPFAVTAAIGVALLFLRRFIRRTLDRSFPGDAGYLRRFLAGIAIGEGVDLVRLRVQSLFVITAKIFMKRIRGQGYTRLYEDPGFQGRRVASMIYRLEQAAPRLGEPGWLAPSPAQREVARRANAMPTTLWFETSAQLRDCVAAGQSTLCFQLLRHFFDPQNAVPASPARAQLAAALEELWKKLREDPFCLLPTSPAR